MELDQIRELIACLEASKLRKIVLKKGDFELHLEKDYSMASHLRKAGLAETPTASQELSFPSEVSLKGERGGRHIAAQEETRALHVISPLVGTFYGSPAPDRPPFVKVGDRVQEDTVVCIVEAMKVMNEVKAGVSGTVAEILVENGHPVEYGTRLFKII